METLGQYQILYDHLKGKDNSIFDREVREGDQEYLMLGLTKEECKLAL